jgi:hypothetical protein
MPNRDGFQVLKEPKAINSTIKNHSGFLRHDGNYIAKCAKMVPRLFIKKHR